MLPVADTCVLLCRVTARLHQRNKLRATCCLKQHVARNTQLVAGNKQLAVRNMMLVSGTWKFDRAYTGSDTSNCRENCTIYELM